MSSIGQLAGNKPMHRLLDELNSSKLSIENDGKAYNKVRDEIEDVNKKVLAVYSKNEELDVKLRETYQCSASRGSDVNLHKIKLTVVDESIKALEKEITMGWDELAETRKTLARVATSFLNDAVKFSKTYNSSDYGLKNRAQLILDSIEDMKLQEADLNDDLADYFKMEKSVKDAEEEKENMKKQFQEYQIQVLEKEEQLKQKLKESEEILNEWISKEHLFNEKCENEIKILNGKISKVQESIAFWERKVSDSRRSVNSQASRQVRFEPPQVSSEAPTRHESGRQYQPLKSSNPPPSKIRAMTNPHTQKPSPASSNSNLNVSISSMFASSGNRAPANQGNPVMNKSTPSSRTFHFKKKSSSDASSSF